MIRSGGERPSELAQTALPSKPAATEGAPTEAVPGAPGTSTPLSQVVAAGMKAAAAALGSAADAMAVSLPPEPEVTGIIFVHGIGSQAPGETLLQWSTPIIKGVTAWRAWASPPGRDEPLDPVVGATMDFKSELPTITLSIPAWTSPTGTHPEARWILTESWWAAKVAPPGLSTMTSWLGPQRGAEQIVAAILGNPSATSPGLRAFRAAVVPFVSVLGALILSVYALVRGFAGLIPIKAVKNAAVLREFDEFLTGWFGDVRILLFDPAQSANIREGLADAVERLRARGCSRVVVVAHSGGAMVSYLTLSDPTLAPRAQVDKLITFGEGWNLALTLTPGGAGMADRLRRDITRVQPNLRWRDFWASHDPAPAGQLKTTEIPPEPGGTQPARPDAVRTYRVWNRRSLLDDHGTYFENDEEFTIPVLREIDAADGWGETSRFYPESAPEPVEGAPVSRDDPRGANEARVLRHRQRVALLAVWRHFSLCLPVAVVAIILSSPTQLERLGTVVANRLPRLPLIGDGIDWLRNVKALNLDLPLLSSFDLLPAANLVGLATLQAIVIIAVLQLIAAPAGAYHAWPEGGARRAIVKAAEIAVAVGLLLSFVPLVFSSLLPPRFDVVHDRFLGAGGLTWLPGVVATIVTLLIAWGGPELVRRSKRPAAASLFGFVSTVVFVLAMASSVITIFQRDGLELGELGYIFIWVAFLVLYKIGHSRWSQWDRVERIDSYGGPEQKLVTRGPAVVSSLGFVLAATAIIAYVFGWPIPVVGMFAAISIGLILTAIAWSAAAWQRGDPIAAPPPVGAAGV